MRPDPRATDERTASLHTCIVQPLQHAVSETFLHAQATGLPGRVTVVHGFPPYIGDQPVWSQSLLARAARKVRRLLPGGRFSHPQTAGYLDALRRVQPSVVLAQYGPTGAAVREACRLLDIPLVVHFHGFDASRRSVIDEHRLGYRLLFEDAAAIIVVSRPMASRLQELGADATRIFRNPCGVDSEHFRGAAPASSAPVLVSVGRFVDKKAPHLTIDAFAQAHQQVPEARLRMIGDGPLLERCKQQVERLGLQSAVQFLGPQRPAVVQEEMRRARAFVQHSVEAPSGDSEGLPVGILEAGASGLPVISTRHAGIPEAVIEGETGILVDEGDVAGMGRAMTRLLQDGELAARLGSAGQDHVRRHFALDRRIAILGDILAGSARRWPASRIREIAERRG
jgi:colanic acid/amylovoran biosynthesis glycosyltransferase